MDRRSFVIGSGASAAALAAGTAFAQEAFPSHAITIINAFPPGGANDIVTRPLAAVLEPILKQPVVIETKAGAGGQVGAQVAASAKPDGYTLLSHNTGISGYRRSRQAVRPRAEIHPRRFHSARASDRRSGRAAGQRAAAVQDAEGIHRRRQEAPGPDHLQLGGLYGATHLPMALLAKAAGGLKLRHLPTNGGGPAIAALLGNNQPPAYPRNARRPGSRIDPRRFGVGTRRPHRDRARCIDLSAGITPDE